jgi:hypothetical protein
LIVPEPSSEWLERVRALQLQNDSYFASAAGLTTDDYRARALETLRALVAEAEVQVRIRPDRLASVLSEAIWKTLFDGVASAGLNDVAARTEVEATVIGIPRDAHATARPAYGYLSGSDEESLEWYGDVILHLRRESRSRVTFCLADSLNASDRGTYPVLAAAPLEDPSLEARHGETEMAFATSLVEACDPRDRFAEAHIHGRVAAQDVVWAGFTQRDPDAGLARALLNAGIRFVPPD